MMREGRAGDAGRWHTSRSSLAASSAASGGLLLRLASVAALLCRQLPCRLACCASLHEPSFCVAPTTSSSSIGGGIGSLAPEPGQMQLAAVGDGAGAARKARGGIAFHGSRSGAAVGCRCGAGGQCGCQERGRRPPWAQRRVGMGPCQLWGSARPAAGRVVGLDWRVCAGVACRDVSRKKMCNKLARICLSVFLVSRMCHEWSNMLPNIYHHHRCASDIMRRVHL